MTTRSTTNSLGQQIGESLDWSPRRPPPRTPVEGRFCRVEILDTDRHAADLFDANSLDTDGRNWTYLAYGPFDQLDSYQQWMRAITAKDDPLFHAIVDVATNKAVGVASLMRIDAAVGVIETGHINYSPRLQQQPAATEAMYLLMRRVFDELGYRRYEWKCDVLNAPSQAAAKRLGFSFEGIFRQATVYRQRNRDTAWFSVIDSEWPALKLAFERWLSQSNFDSNGQQQRSLASFRQ